MLKRRKWFKRLALLLTGLSLIGILGVNKCSRVNNTQTPQAITIESQEGLTDIKSTVREISNEFRRVNKLTVLEGNTKTDYTFSNKNKEITEASKTSCISWIKQKFSDLTLNEVSYKSSYDYSFSYDFNKIEIRTDNGNLEIHIYETDLQLDSVKENHNETQVTSEKGVLAKQFTPSEVSGMSKYVNNKTYNKLVNDKDLKDTAMESLKANIDSLCEGLKVKDYKVIIHSNPTLAYEDAYLK